MRPGNNYAKKESKMKEKRQHRDIYNVFRRFTAWFARMFMFFVEAFISFNSSAFTTSLFLELALGRLLGP